MTTSGGLHLLSSQHSGGKKKDHLRSIKQWWWIWFIVAISPCLPVILYATFCTRRINRKLMQQTGEGDRIQDKSLLALRSKKTLSYKLCDSNKAMIGKQKESGKLCDFIISLLQLCDFFFLTQMGHEGWSM